jgi:ABC-type glycerol-3-phosphate transport system substrate-binding protein
MKERISLGHFLAGEELSHLNKMIELFNQESRFLEVIPQLVSPDEEGMLEKIIDLYKSKIAPTLSTMYAEKIAKLAKLEIIVPLDDFIKETEEFNISDFPENLFETVTYKNKIWGIPLIEANPYGLFCNLELFKEAGIKSPPVNWEELEEYSRILTKAKDGKLINQWGYTQCSFQYPLLLWQNNGEILDKENKKILFNSPEGVETLQFYVNLRSKYSPPHVDFERGDVGMKLGIVQNIPRYKGIKFTVAPLPFKKRRANSFGGSKSAHSFVILNQEISKQKLAWEFIKWWIRDENYLRWCISTNYIPLKKSVTQDERYQEHLKKNPLLLSFLEEIPFCKARPCIPNYPEIKFILNNAVNFLREKEIVKKEEIKRCLDTYAKQAQQLLLKDE